MAKKKNQLSGMVGVENADERNRVNVKHIVSDTERITVGGIVSVKFNSRRYKASVIDLLGCTASRKHRTKMQKPPRQCHSNSCKPQERKVGNGVAKKAGTYKVQNSSNCDGIPCPPYDPQKELTCAVCTK